MPNKKTNQELVTWIPITRDLPDEESTVLVALEDGTVEAAFLESSIWRYLNADSIDEPVTHWAEYPDAPSTR